MHVQIQLTCTNCLRTRVVSVLHLFEALLRSFRININIEKHKKNDNRKKTE